MAFVLPTLAVAFAAFCIWLTVRIVNRREQWAKWTLAAVVGLPVLYVLSFGPAHVLSDRMGMDDPLFWKFYKPIEWMVDYGPRPLRDALERYSGLWN